MNEAVEEYRRVGTDVPAFSMRGIHGWARVVSIYDGDTLTIVMPLHGIYYRFNVRLTGIDTCEIKSKNTELRKLAYAARNRLYAIIYGAPWSGDAYSSKSHLEAALKDRICIIWVECEEFDKYGRLLVHARVFEGAMSFSEVLIQEKLGYVYGATDLTKLSEKEQMANLAGKN